MYSLVIKLPQTQTLIDQRAKMCPFCKCEVLQRWGESKKTIQDDVHKEIRFYRYRCCRCHRTFRLYKGGVNRTEHSTRLNTLVVIYWLFGWSVRNIQIALSEMGIILSRMSIWRDINNVEENLSKQTSALVRLSQLFQITHERDKESREFIGIIVNSWPSQYITLGFINEKDIDTCVDSLKLWSQFLNLEIHLEEKYQEAVNV